MAKASQTKVRCFSRSGLPAFATTIIDHLTRSCRDGGRSCVSFSVPMLPKSVNHMYTHSRYNTRLQPWVEEFRAAVKNAMTAAGISWRPRGITAAVILMSSPTWITAESKVRKFDADNKLKPIFDAIEKATGSPDENHWSFHVFKVPSKRERLSVYLFDLGDVVEYYY